MSDFARIAGTFEQTLRVELADLDDQAHVNNVVYVRWVQETATAHWLALAPPAVRAELAWVTLRHEIDYVKPALLGDVLVVRTRVGKVERITSSGTPKCAACATTGSSRGRARSGAPSIRAPGGHAA